LQCARDAIAVLTCRCDRRRPVDPTIEPNEVPVVDPGGDSDSALRETIGRCLEHLPAMPRRAIDVRLGNPGVPDESLAENVTMTLNTFYQNIRRARLALAECLRRHGFNLGWLP
jgi:DNA-directed RNA polymerase specialized sigma24 family protein